MNAWTDPEIEHIILCFGTQLGKTESLQNCLGFSIHQDPGPALVVYPIDNLAEFASENRLEPMILACPALAERYDKRASEKLELQFTSMYVALGGANSPSELASRPIRYLLRDEIDKFPRWSGKEANPLSLSEERTKTFYNRKIIDASTPTLKTGPIWQMVETADRLMRYHVPCPHCGTYQALTFKQIKFPEEQPGWDERRRSDAAHYECEHCKGSIDDQQKLSALRLGRWVTEREREGQVRSVAFHLSSLYSPWVTWSRIVFEFLTSKDFPEKLMNFINSWLAEPWEDKATALNSDKILKKAGGHERGTVPADAIILTAGVDVQKDHMWYSVRAWGEKLTSWLVEYGRAETWTEIEDALIERRYESEEGRRFAVNLTLLDTGYRTDEVYDLCAVYPGLFLPAKGSSNKLLAPYTISTLDKRRNQKHAGMKLYIVDTAFFKDFIVGRIQKETDEPGAWMVFKDCPRQFAEQITSEQKVIGKDRKGRPFSEWVPISSHASNHLLDCEVLAACAAEIIGVRYLRKELLVQPRQRRVISRGVSY